MGQVSDLRGALERDVVPVLLEELRASTSRPIVLTCMLALAKMDIADEDTRLLPLLTRRLTSDNQEIRETAALSLGLTRSRRALAPLIDIFLDTRQGRDYVERVHVDDRTRAFAGYGIGLVGAQATDPALARLAAMALEQGLLRAGEESRDVVVAAISGLRSIAPMDIGTHLVRPLRQLYVRQHSRTDETFMAHVPPALAAILGRGGDSSGEIVDQLVRDLGDDARSHLVRQSAAIALGELCDASAKHAPASEALWAYVRDGRDQQARGFSLVALGRIGGDANRAALLQRLRSATTIERPWVALALGVLAHAQRAVSIDQTIGRALRGAMLDSKNEDVIASAALAIGLAGDAAHAADIRALLASNRQRDELAAHLCTALALLDDQTAIPLLREITAESRRRPKVLTDAAGALVRLGDRGIGNDLAILLTESGHELATLGGVAASLGTVGDARCIAPLLAVVARRDVPDLGRAYAIVALGGIGDHDDVPAVNLLARFLNYRATVETLTNQSTGVLDVL